MIDDSDFSRVYGRTNSNDRTMPEFFRQAVEIPFKSAQEGRPVYEDREFVRIICPGNSKSIPVEIVTDDHKRRWPREYAAFEANQALPVIGTPIEEWAAITPATALNLKSARVRSVEDLASLSDGDLQFIGIGGRDLRAKAQAFLGDKSPKESALERELAELKAKVAEMETRKPGRPRKEALDDEPKTEAA